MHVKFPRAMVAAVLLASIAIAPASADPPAESAVAKWNRLATAALIIPGQGAGQPPQVGVLHLAMVQGAVYDAVNAIVGGYEPYLDDVGPAAAGASLDAAVATAAYDVLLGLDLPSDLPSGTLATLATELGASLSAIPDGAAKTAGIAIGADAAATMLAARAGDGRFPTGTFAFPTGTGIGQWRPTGSGNDPNAWVADVAPFVIDSGSQFRTDGPLDVSSAAYAEEYNEVKALGAAVNSSRTQEQTDLALFYAGNPVEMYNRTFRTIVADQGLDTAEEARLFAMLNFAGADGLISCWDDKRAFAFWRPVTAIQNGDSDGNSATDGDANWMSFRPSPPYPDHPSGYNCLTGAMMGAARDFFGTDRISFSMTANATLQPRQYARFTDVLKDTIDARIYLGFHFRTPELQGAIIGKKVAHWMDLHYFRPTD